MKAAASFLSRLLLLCSVGLSMADSDAQFALGPDPTYLDLLGANVNAVEYEYAAAAPAVVVEEVAPPPVVNSQFHAQSELGEYEYGYSNPTATKYERKDALGRVEGTYSYVSPDGRVVTNNYLADATGFRSSLAPANDPEWNPAAAYAVEASAGIPGAHIAPPVAPAPAPVPAPVAPVAVAAPIPDDPLVGVEIGRAIAHEVYDAPLPVAASAHAFPVHDAVPIDYADTVAVAAAVPAVLPEAAAVVPAVRADPLPAPNLIRHAVRHHVAPAAPIHHAPAPVVSRRVEIAAPAPVVHRRVEVAAPAPVVSRRIEVAAAPAPVVHRRVVERPSAVHYEAAAPAAVVTRRFKSRPATVVRKAVVKSLPSRRTFSYRHGGASRGYAAASYSRSYPSSARYGGYSRGW